MQTHGYRGRTASGAFIKPATLDDGRIVGQFVRDNDGLVALEKHVRLRYRLRKPEGWAIDAHHLAELAALGGGSIRLSVDDGAELTASLEDFDDFGVSIDHGFGEQVVLPLDYWNDSAGQPNVPRPLAPEAQPQARQTMLEGFPGSPSTRATRTQQDKPARHRQPVGISPVYAAVMRASWGQEVQP